MTWTLATSNGFESDKIAALTVAYLQGDRVLDIGCGMRKVWPSVIGVDNKHHFGNQTVAEINSPAHDLSLFADESCDAVFSSHLVEHYEKRDVPALFNEWARVLKPGGKIVLYVPSANFYPLVGEHGANPDHKWNIYGGDIEQMFATGNIGQCFWHLLEQQERSNDNEYSFFLVFKKGVPLPQNFSGSALDTSVVEERNKHKGKRLLVVRYGAIGDMIQTAMLLPALKKQGWHITVNCNFTGADVLKNNPHVDELIVQDKNFVPNAELGAYWQTLAREYDKFINLSECIEGSLLAIPGRILWQYPDTVRHTIVGKINYFERMAEIAEATEAEPCASFYPSRDEMQSCMKLLRSYSNIGSRPVIGIVMTGSGPDKTYPFWDRVIRQLLDTTNAVILLLGDGGVSRYIADAVMQTITHVNRSTRLFNLCGKLELRESLTLATQLDVIAGPETGLMNCAAFCSNHKVLLLSHSTIENLSRDWQRTISLSFDGIPSHKLHKDWNDCEQDKESGAAVCMAGISAERVTAAIMSSLLSACRSTLRTKG